MMRPAPKRRMKKGDEFMRGECGGTARRRPWRPVAGGAAAALLAAGLLLTAPAARADDRHEGYYYPEVTSSEVYRSRIQTLADSDRTRRIGFVTGVTTGQTERPYAPITAMFAKGTEAEKLILIGLQNGPLDTLYRARAVLAMLTATARTTAVFRDLDPLAQYTFLDLLKLLGFTQITVSDGKSWAHRIDID
jgi:hypothetical protein